MELFKRLSYRVEWLLWQQNSTVYQLMINIKSLNQILNDVFEIELRTSNYFYSFENQSHAHVFDAAAVQTW